MKKMIILLILIQGAVCNALEVKGTIQLVNNSHPVKEIEVTTGNMTALLVVVDDYKLENTNTIKLKIKKDLTEISNVLKKSGYAVNEMIASEKKEGTLKPTRDNILDTIEEIGKKSENTDLFVFYFSGHGEINYLITYDYDENEKYLKECSLEVKELIKRISDNIKSNNIVLMVDACHSGNAHSCQIKDLENERRIISGLSVIKLHREINKEKEELNKEKLTKKTNNYANFHILTSTNSDQQESHANHEISYFAKSLVRGLNGEADGCAINQEIKANQKIDLAELHCFIMKDVQNEINKDANIQRKINNGEKLLWEKVKTNENCKNESTDKNYWVIEGEKYKIKQQTAKVSGQGNQTSVVLSNIPEVFPPRQGAKLNKYKLWEWSLNWKSQENDKLCIEFVLLPSDKYTAGLRKNEKSYILKNYKEYAKDLIEDNSYKEIRVENVWFGKYEISNEQYACFLNNSKNYDKQVVQTIDNYSTSKIVFNEKTKRYEVVINFEKYPVNHITFSAAKEFIRWLNQISNDKYVFTLPTEIEWEYACRSGKNTLYYHGNEIENSNISVQPSNIGLTKGTDKQINGWNLHHMNGNVLEWCYSCKNEDIYTKKEKFQKSILKGGSFKHRAIFANCCNRFINVNELSNIRSYHGFRVISKNKY